MKRPNIGRTLKAERKETGETRSAQERRRHYAALETYMNAALAAKDKARAAFYNTQMAFFGTREGRA